MNFGKDMCNKACCYVTCKCRSKFSVNAHLDENVKALFLLCPDMPPSLIDLELMPICILHRAEPKEGDKEYKKGSQEGSWPFHGWPVPTSQKCTVCCLLNKSSVCLSCSWAINSLLFWILATMRWEWRNPSCFSMISLSFQIFI